MSPFAALVPYKLPHLDHLVAEVADGESEVLAHPDHHQRQINLSGAPQLVGGRRLQLRGRAHQLREGQRGDVALLGPDGHVHVRLVTRQVEVLALKEVMKERLSDEGGWVTKAIQSLIVRFFSLIAMLCSCNK